MIRKIAILIAVMAAVALTATAAFGVSPSQLACEADGGTFTRVNGEVTCVYPPVEDPVGNSENSNGNSQTTTTTEEESSNGTLNNDPQFEEETACTGPGNGGSTAQCP